MHQFASPHTSSLAASMLEDVDTISDRTLPRVIAAMLWQQGVTADEFYLIGRSYSGVSYNKVWILEALRGLEDGTLQVGDCLRGADQIQSVINKTRLLVERRRGRHAISHSAGEPRLPSVAGRYRRAI